MGRPKGSSNKSNVSNVEDKEVGETVGETTDDKESLKVEEGSLAHDKTTTAPGIHEGKRPKFGKDSF